MRAAELKRNLDLKDVTSSAACSTDQIDLLCALTCCCFPGGAAGCRSSALLPAPPSGSRAIYGTFERLLSGTITRPARRKILLLNLVPYKVHSTHFLCMVGFARAENNVDGEASLSRLKRDRAQTYFGLVSRWGRKERLRATPLFTTSSSEEEVEEDAVSFINVGPVIGYLAGFWGNRKGKWKKQKKLWERPRRGFDTTLIMRSRS